MDPLDKSRVAVKTVMRHVASLVNKISEGKITPNHVTFAGLIMHIPIAWLIATGHTLLAAVLLAFFGLFDTLDGALARLQKRETSFGMFFDSSTDRIKEILVYCGIMALLFTVGDRLLAVVTVAALGASLCTSYLNAWGEAILAGTKRPTNLEINKTFRTGFLGFDVRMTLIIIGLLINELDWVMYIILVLAAVTVAQRFTHIARRLSDV